MHLSALLPDETAARLPASMRTCAVSALSCDSRQIKSGTVFFALKGLNVDGAAFVADALARGAALVVCEHAPAGLESDPRILTVANARALLSFAAARFYPRQPQTIISVTGTSGKTSVVEFCRQIFTGLGHKAASYGTLGLVSATLNHKGALTTPDPLVLHQHLEEAALAGITHLALEASSHGLEQHRLDAVDFAACAFTNLSRDHLDYHATMETYFAAKLRLLDLASARKAPLVLDADSAIATRVEDEARARHLSVLRVGEAGNFLQLCAIKPQDGKILLQLLCAGETHSVAFPLLGRYQISNALVAAALVIACGGEPRAVLPLLAALSTVRGRLEDVGQYQGARIVIDYAHKPDALEKALLALRPHVTRRLCVVFGCGGDRDPGKRPLMGAIAARLADDVIITDDNPRSEDAATIRAQIRQAAPCARDIGDRGKAIVAALETLQKGDVLLIAGKGHEEGQIVGDRVLPFSDHAVVCAFLSQHRADGER